MIYGFSKRLADMVFSLAGLVIISPLFLVVALLIILLVPKVPYTVGIIGAIVATIVEAVSIHRDDNLTVPLISGLVMHLLVLMFPLLP